jgi:hypothetical protein
MLDNDRGKQMIGSMNRMAFFATFACVLQPTFPPTFPPTFGKKIRYGRFGRETVEKAANICYTEHFLGCGFNNINNWSPYIQSVI